MPRTRLILEYQIDHAITEELATLRLLLKSAAKLGNQTQIADIKRLMVDAEFQLAECVRELAAMDQPDTG